MRDSVLLVDDEPNILRAYKRHLGNVFALQTATNAEEALQLFENAGPFAVIVSDLRMPGKDGIQLLREVKERYPDTGRILLTGHGDFESVASAVNEGGIHQYLTKPTPADLLGRSIEASLKNHERQMLLVDVHIKILGYTIDALDLPPGLFQHFFDGADRSGGEPRRRMRVRGMGMHHGDGF